MSNADSLVSGYCAATVAAGRGVALSSAVLGDALGQIFARARAEHPDIRVEAAAFGAHLAACRAPLGEPAQLIPAGDLLLACAALAGNTKAMAKVRDISLQSIRSYLRRIDMPQSALEEIAQDVWNELLVPATEDRSPTLARYAGTGSLRAYIGVAARRLTLRRCRHEDVVARAAARAAAEASALVDDVELGMIKVQYREACRQAIEGALQTLDDRARMLLRMRIIDDLTVDTIARTYGVAQSSISRWLESARRKIITETRRLLCQRLGMSSREFDSLWRVVASQVEIGVSGILGCET